MKGLKQRGVLRPGASGTLRWRWADDTTTSVGFRCECEQSGEGRRLLLLTYKATDRQTGEQREHRITVGLAAEACPLGGEQWYFLCPGPGCGARVRQLRIPPGEELFACRRCYDLTYESCR